MTWSRTAWAMPASLRTVPSQKTGGGHCQTQKRWNRRANPDSRLSRRRSTSAQRRLFPKRTTEAWKQVCLKLKRNMEPRLFQQPLWPNREVATTVQRSGPMSRLPFCARVQNPKRAQHLCYWDRKASQRRRPVTSSCPASPAIPCRGTRDLNQCRCPARTRTLTLKRRRMFWLFWRLNSRLHRRRWPP